MKHRTLLLPTLVGLALAASPAWSADLVDYKVKGGDTCESIAKKQLGDDKRCDEIRANNPAVAGPKDKLTAGTVLRIPAPPPDARLTAASGTFTIGGGASKAGARLEAGTEVTTGADGHAELALKDGSRLHLDAGVQLWVLGAPPAKGAKKPTLGDTTLVSGAVRVLVAEGAKKPLVIATAVGKVSVSAGEAKVQLDDGVLRVAVYAGKAVVDSGGKKTEVGPGQGVRVEAKAKGAPKPVPLLAAPAWTKKPPKLMFSPAQWEGTGITPPTGADSIRWVVARDAEFHDVVTDQKVPAASALAFERPKAAGTYHLRASALDADGLEGPALDAATVRIADGHVVASVPGKRAAFVVEAGLVCDLESEPSITTTGAPIEVRAGMPHTLLCTPQWATIGNPLYNAGAVCTSPGAPCATLSMTATEAGALTVTSSAGAPSFDKTAGTLAVTVTVADPSGAGVDGATVTVSSSAGTVDPPKPGPKAGDYLFALHWNAGVKTTKLRFLVNGTTKFDTELALPSPPPPPPEVVAAAPPPATLRAEAGLAAGVFGATDLGVGTGLLLEFGGRYLVGPGALTAHLRLGFERYALAHTNDVTCSGLREGTPCGSSGVSHYLSSVSGTAYTVGVPITYRHGAHDASFRPYVGVIPQLVFDVPTETSKGGVMSTGVVSPSLETTDKTTRFALVALLGIDVRASASAAVFLEAGWRFTSEHTLITRDAGLGGPIGTIGLRIGL